MGKTALLPLGELGSITALPEPNSLSDGVAQISRRPSKACPSRSGAMQPIGAGTPRLFGRALPLSSDPLGAQLEPAPAFSWFDADAAGIACSIFGSASRPRFSAQRRAVATERSASRAPIPQAGLEHIFLERAQVNTLVLALPSGALLPFIVHFPNTP
jgi:hypothetical protein